MLPLSQNKKKKAKTIVIVDDSLDLTRIYKQVLELEGYQVFLVGNGPDALGLLDHISPPDLLLVDCLMPGMSGIEFLKELKLKDPSFSENTPIVGISGLFLESSLLTEMQPLVRHLIEKPNDIGEVVRLVNENVR